MRRLLLGLIFALAPVWMAQAQDGGSVIGTVKVVSGEAAVERGDTVLEAVEGLDVLRRDQLRTGADGAVGVTLNDGTLISLGPNSRFELSSFEFAPQRDAFGFLGRILQGTMVYQSGRIGKIAPENIQIRTPLSVVAVRGTRFAVRVPAQAGQ
ncbi:MAG: FecR family protein [Thalassobaculaceae bacterium]|nr:FecR family protein [Thalassobaculaceae bacterium]